MSDVQISGIPVQALANDSLLEVEDNVGVSGQNTLQNLITLINLQIGGQVGTVFADITARDLGAASLKAQEFVEVTDASSDPEINAGTAWYRWVTGTTFILVASDEALATPVTTDKGSTPLTTSGNGQSTGISFSEDLVGCAQFHVHGISEKIGDGVKTTACYASGDGGTTARAWTAIVAGDVIYWNGVIAGYDLSATTEAGKCDLIYHS